MGTVIGDRVIDHVVSTDPVEHPLDVGGAVAVAEQPPLGERDGLAVLRGEVGVRPQPVRLVDVVGELLPGPLVVAVHADDVDHVVTGVAVRPGDRVKPAAGGEVEAEALAGRLAHGRHDAPPVLLPRLRVGSAPAGVGGAVHLPAEHDDRVLGAGGDQLSGEFPEPAVVGAVRSLGQPPGHGAVGHLGLVRSDHRHVQRQDAARPGGSPAGPGVEDLRVASLEGLPAFAGQIGAPDRHLAPQPRLEARQELGTARVGGQEDAQRRGAGGQSGRGRAQADRRHHRTRDYRERKVQISFSCHDRTSPILASPSFSIPHVSAIRISDSRFA